MERALAEQRAREAAEAALPPLRDAEAAASAELHRLTHIRGALEQELQRVLAAHSEAERRLAQLTGDLQREDQQLAEAEAALARLAEERLVLARVDAQDDPAHGRWPPMVADRDSGRFAEAEVALQRETEAVASPRRAALRSIGADASSPTAVPAGGASRRSGAATCEPGRRRSSRPRR